MNQTDKDIIKNHLHKAVTLIQTDRPATALRSIADALSVVAVSLESQTSGAHGMTLAEFAGQHAGVAYSHEHTRETVEAAAIAAVKPLCPSGLLATLQGITEDKNPQCPACGLFHERRVVAVPLSTLGYGFVEAEATLRVGFGTPHKYREGDRIVFSDRDGKVSRGYVGDVTEIKELSVDAGGGFEAITKVITL